MSVYVINDIGSLLRNNPYAGRGIIAGMSQNGKYAVSAYFIMGRSANSRNRIFEKRGQDVIIKPFDPSMVEAPSLIIYSPVRVLDNKLIVTNGDQTDTIYDFVNAGKSFKQALETRCFEPDAPNFTPRISAMITFSDGGFSYEMSILKSMDECGTQCARYIFSYAAASGLGHFIHTYETDGNPLPTFRGEPERIAIPDSIDEFTREIWTNLNEQNKISLFVRFTDLSTGETEDRMINKHTA